MMIGGEHTGILTQSTGTVEMESGGRERVGGVREWGEGGRE